MRKVSHRDANHYRARAEECRTIAEQFLHGEMRERMFKIASEYEMMADTADELGRVVHELDEQTPVHSRTRKYR